MNRGRIESPNLDDRRWQDIVNEAKALIPKYTPDWTDHGPADVGITLIELFAWMMENTLYRLNRVPEKHYIELLNLLGITRDPATPASTWLTFTLTGGAAPVTLPTRFGCSTAPTEQRRAVIFETDRAVQLLPVNLVRVLKLEPPGEPINHTGHLTKGPLQEVDFDAHEVGSGATPAVWLLGLDGAPPVPDFVVHVSSLQPRTAEPLEISWAFSKTGHEPKDWVDDAGALQRDETLHLRREGNIRLKHPGAAWTPVNVAGDDLFWLRMTIHVPTGKGTVPLRFRHLLFNSVSSTSVLSVGGLPGDNSADELESLGVSDGKPFQRMELQHRPVFRDPLTPSPFHHVELFVSEPDTSGGLKPQTKWKLEEDLPAGDQEVYLLDDTTGTVQLGDFDTRTDAISRAENRHGRIPPEGSELRIRYRYVSDAPHTNVEPQAVTQFVARPDSLSAVESVVNPGPGREGSVEESLDDAMQRAPRLLRSRNRAVTLEDYEFLAVEAATDIYRAKALPPRELQTGQPFNFGQLNRTHGRINVLLLPTGLQENVLQERRPAPSNNLIEEVQRFLDQRKTALTALTVTTPRYLKIKVTLNARIFPDKKQEVDKGQLETELDRALTRFLHPVHGGLEKSGWLFGENVFTSGFHAVAGEILNNRGYVHNLEIAPEPAYSGDRPPTVLTANFMDKRVGVKVADYELVCSDDDHAIEVEVPG